MLFPILQNGQENTLSQVTLDQSDKKYIIDICYMCIKAYLKIQFQTYLISCLKLDASESAQLLGESARLLDLLGVPIS